jgi:dTDP-4-amino-4,6-dideoxygalactose transaminase
VTKKLADRTIGLPCFPDMSAEDIKQVAATVTRALGPTAASAPFAGLPAAT